MSQFKQYWNEISHKDKADFYISFCVIFLAGIFIVYYAFPNARTQKSKLLKENVQFSEVRPPDSFVINEKVYQRVEVIVDDNNEEISQLINESIDKRESYSVGYMDSTVFALDNFEEKGQALMNERMSSNGSSMYVDSIINDDSQKLNDVEAFSEQVDNTNKFDTSRLISIRDSMPFRDSIGQASHEEEHGVKQNDSDEKLLIEDCVILIGTYHSDQNALNMQARLESAGYNVFFVKNKRHTKVGTYVSCNIDTIRLSLKDIRNQFAKDAFLYKRQ